MFMNARTSNPSIRRGVALTAFCLVLTLRAAEVPTSPPGARWWKGNLHTHSLWSDGDDFPEVIAAWYKSEGYHFLALSDHNVLLEGDEWLAATNSRVVTALGRMADPSDRGRVQWREKDGRREVRLKTFNELRRLFEEPEKFLLIPAEEITDRHLAAPVHLNATNLREFIPPQGGSNVVDVMQNNVNAVIAQRRRTGQPMFPHVNHPNFGWGVTAEELMRVRGERFFEVYNGHPLVANEGDPVHASTERMWDIVLAWRIGVLNLEPLFGLAVDDSHNYGVFAPTNSNPGRGWAMVRSPRLTPEAIVEAMEAGDFYASSGVTLMNVRRGPMRYEIEIKPENGVTYTTQFIGTRKGFDRSNEPVRAANGELLRVTHRYSAEVGEVLSEVKGVRPAYKLTGDELYVRATVTSSRRKTNPCREGELEKAWTQPLVLPTARP